MSWKKKKILHGVFHLGLNFSGFSTYQFQKQRSGGVVKNFAKVTGKDLCQGLFFDKVAGLKLAQNIALLKQANFPTEIQNNKSKTLICEQI